MIFGANTSNRVPDEGGAVGPVDVGVCLLRAHSRHSERRNQQFLFAIGRFFLSFVDKDMNTKEEDSTHRFGG
jgi:hypothetical protein